MGCRERKIGKNVTERIPIRKSETRVERSKSGTTKRENRVELLGEE